ncbi:uncharacterized protein LOC5515831 isoform X1 [Nematostella vectensis]|uniref:uncharacterized protein LOC5515831 isoform X1 n=2 Tax=Nematostella vectensis TaxID=45351 RepID=UPI0020778B18|nr:uncharacterized protein LOC5515831 isoform X1 [Nematostella vectensis]
MALLFRGESRWKILSHPLFWLKVAEIVFPLFMFPYCITYNQQGGVYVHDQSKSCNITLKYPFKYDNSTAVCSQEDAPPMFSFDTAISVCAQFFVGVAISSVLVAAIMVVVSIVVHKNGAKARIVITVELFLDILVSFLLVISTSLWLYNLLNLKKKVNNELLYIANVVERSHCFGPNYEKCIPTEYEPDYSVLFVSLGFGYLTFVIWLVNTVAVYRDLLDLRHREPDASLIWTQELPETSNS